MKISIIRPPGSEAWAGIAFLLTPENGNEAERMDKFEDTIKDSAGDAEGYGQFRTQDAGFLITLQIDGVWGRRPDRDKGV
jgi:hypothetical protein